MANSRYIHRADGTMWLLVLVGAEGISETRGKPWLRPATPEEHARFETETGKDIEKIGIDGNGRPYWLMAVDSETAPAEAVEKARNNLRVLRLVQ